MSELFDIVGIKKPGKVDLYRIGTVNLFDCSDDRLIEIYKSKTCHYLRPTAKGMKILHPEVNIAVKQNPAVKTPDKPKTSRKKKAKK